MFYLERLKWKNLLFVKPLWNVVICVIAITEPAKIAYEFSNVFLRFFNALLDDAWIYNAFSSWLLPFPSEALTSARAQNGANFCLSRDFSVFPIFS